MKSEKALAVVVNTVLLSARNGRNCFELKLLKLKLLRVQTYTRPQSKLNIEIVPNELLCR
jgi:hypothetical protein